MMTRGQSQLDQTGTDSGPEASARPLHVQLWSYNYDPEPTGIGPVSKVLAEGLRSRATTSRSSPPTRTIPCRGGGSESSPTPALWPTPGRAACRGCCGCTTFSPTAPPLRASSSRASFPEAAPGPRGPGGLVGARGSARDPRRRGPRPRPEPVQPRKRRRIKTARRGRAQREADRPSARTPPRVSALRCQLPALEPALGAQTNVPDRVPAQVTSHSVV